jgi:competence protein ComEC
MAVATPAASKGLEIFFIDVEGGQSTLIVTPAGQSLLIDAGYGRGSLRDPERILLAAKAAGIDRIDYFLATHFHADHVGGIPELAKRIPIGTYIDYGAPMGTIYGGDPASRTYAAYAETRGQNPHIVPRPGDRLPIEGLQVDVVSSGGALITAPLSVPLPGAGEVNDACNTIEDHVEDGTENFRSVGVVLRFGAFSFVDLGDLSGNTLSKIICPRNLLGEATVYLIAHHGDWDTDSRAMYAALKPRVAIMNNAAFKGGDPAVFWTARTQPNLDLWQLHSSQFPGAKNAPTEFIANVGNHERDETGYWLRLTASEDGSFTVVNGRQGFSRTYSQGPSRHTN